MTGGAGDGFLYSQGLLVIPRIPLTLTLRQARRWLPLIVGLALMCLMVWAADPLKLAGAVRGFDWRFLLPLTLSYFLYLAFRSARWHLLMRPINAPNSWTDSLLLFCAAQAAVLVPAGQFLLPVLQKSQHGTLIRRSAATVLVQEVMFGLLVLPAALPSILGYQVGGWFLLAAFLISAGAGALILHDGISNGCFFVIDHLPFIGHHCPSLRELRQHVVTVANTPEAILGSAFDLLAIGAAGTGFYLALMGLGQAHIGWIGAMGTYAFGNAVATLSALPGGLGANEDASTAVLGHLGLAAAPAAAATLIFRVMTLLLGTLLGWGVLLLCRERFNMAGPLSVLAATRHGAREAEGACNG